jgi:hypothetical protein
MEQIWQMQVGDGPVIATAIHNGHDLRDEVHQLMALGDAERLREEDPFTALWTEIVETRVVVDRSRFEVDTNRPPEKAVYIRPEDAWGLHVWKQTPPAEVIGRSKANYDAFYAAVHDLYSDYAQRYGRFVVYDLHTYNHRREGPDGPPADPEANPEVNVGTGTLDRARWGGIVERFMDDLRQVDYLGRQLDVRENVKFRGGQFARWAHTNFPESACVLSIEFKKFFMDEWTGTPDPVQIEAIKTALAATLPGVVEALHAVES